MYVLTYKKAFVSVICLIMGVDHYGGKLQIFFCSQSKCENSCRITGPTTLKGKLLFTPFSAKNISSGLIKLVLKEK
jgi:hypothetical protein